MNDSILKGVGFLGFETVRGFIPIGTAFLGAIFDGDLAHVVAITARHVIDQVSGETFSIRINRKDGTAAVIKIEKKFVATYADRAIDLSFFPLSLDPTIYEVVPYVLDRARWLAKLKENGFPSLGSEVVTVGLYTTHYGHLRNRPVVRIGHLAALPEEMVMTDVGYVFGYLIECHSIAGLSGSPVYWSLSKHEHSADGKITSQYANIILGILIGHHVVQSKEDEMRVPQFQTKLESREVRPDQEYVGEDRRTGFAVVLPIQRIFEFFESEPMQKFLKDNFEKARKNSGFRPDAVTVSNADLLSNDENPTHLEDFRRLVDVAARKPEPKD